MRKKLTAVMLCLLALSVSACTTTRTISAGSLEAVRAKCPHTNPEDPYLDGMRIRDSTQAREGFVPYDDDPYTAYASPGITFAQGSRWFMLCSESPSVRYASHFAIRSMDWTMTGALVAGTLSAMMFGSLVWVLSQWDGCMSGINC